ncbi:MAG: hypothetical protein WCW35_11785 [Bacteroidota bacterium]
MAYSKGTLSGDFIEGILSELNGVIAVGVVEITSELAMDTHSTQPDFDADVACANIMEVVKAGQQTIRALRQNESVKDIFITFDSQVHFLTMSKTGKALFYVVTESKGANLSIMRSVIRKYAKGI